MRVSLPPFCLPSVRLHSASITLLTLIHVAVFDRMFSLGVRGSGTDTAPLGTRVPAVAGSAPIGPRRHFLYCSLHPESTTRSKRSREQA